MHAGTHPAEKNQTKAQICIILKRDYKLILFAKPSQKPSSEDFSQNYRTFSKKSYLEHHMTAARNGVTMKHFAGIERFSEHVYANVCSKANSANAAKFLRELIENAPYKVRSIQVDGGSEFMKDFGNACEELKIPLFVLPPTKPTYNGKAERSNRIFREEFYEDLSEDTIVGARRELMRFLQKYNSYRPHSSLRGLTPLEYISKYRSGDSVCLTSV